MYFRNRGRFLAIAVPCRTGGRAKEIAEIRSRN